MSEGLEIVRAYRRELFDVVRGLFTEYVESLGFDLDFQDYEREYAELPGEYAPPDGCLLLAYIDSVVAGCVAGEVGGPVPPTPGMLGAAISR